MQKGYQQKGCQQESPQPVELESTGERVERGLEFINDVRLLCSVEYGTLKLTIRRLLSLRAGSILELDKHQGAPLDIRANGRLVARGEVVVVNDKFGVRVTEITDPDSSQEL